LSGDVGNLIFQVRHKGISTETQLSKRASPAEAQNLFLNVTDSIAR
jgi:hypothetical protein